MNDISGEIYVIQRSKSVSCNAEVIVEREYVRRNCPANAGHRNSHRLPGPITIDGKRSDTTDSLWTEMGDCLMSAWVIETLVESQCTGFETGEVRISEPSSPNLEYFQFRGAGWGGIASENSGIKITDHCGSCGHLKYSALTDPSELFIPAQWDGSDVFMIWPLPMFVFVGGRAAEILKGIRSTGFEMMPIKSMKRSKYGFSPGRLSDWMPRERALRLGKASRIE